tara:strand:+ start:550 stop:795 length:246 start_codon:yes stop_codon:yes gene_type:complete
MTVTSYTATFVKANGENREMNFIRLNDLPETFLNGKIKGNGAQRTLNEGQEVVWDLDNSGFRVFNWKTIVGEATTADRELN